MAIYEKSWMMVPDPVYPMLAPHNGTLTDSLPPDQRGLEAGLSTWQLCSCWSSGPTPAGVGMQCESLRAVGSNITRFARSFWEVRWHAWWRVPWCTRVLAGDGSSRRVVLVACHQCCMM